jgi:hypothetical protein
VLLLNDCLLLLLFTSLSTQSGHFWIYPRTLYTATHITQVAALGYFIRALITRMKVRHGSGRIQRKLTFKMAICFERPIRNGFNNTGICPCNLNISAQEEFAAAETKDRTQISNCDRVGPSGLTTD